MNFSGERPAGDGPQVRRGEQRVRAFPGVYEQDAPDLDGLLSVRCRSELCYKGSTNIGSSSAFPSYHSTFKNLADLLGVY